jgi:hypothetical protein
MNSSLHIAKQYSISFSGHDSFPLRHGWLEKAYQAVTSEFDVNPFTAQDSVVKFGVGKNMVNAIKHWATASNFLVKNDEGYAPSEYASRLMLDIDPYLENANSLWKIHYELAKTTGNTTIYWIFSLLNVQSFSKEYLELKLQEFCVEQGKSIPAKKSLRTDVNVSLALYCRAGSSKGIGEEDISSPLHELKLLSVNSDGSYSINTGAKISLSDELFMHALIDFWEEGDLAAGTNSTSIRADRLIYEEKAPGRIFALTELELLERVGRMPALSNGMFTTSETAGVVQIFKNQETYDGKILKNKWMGNE